MDAGVDQDGDGYPVPTDCDDTNPNIKPGVQELCVDWVDNNCNQATDCADTACDGQMCVTGGGAVCSGQACHETSCGDSADNDGDGMADCADADCAGQACGVGGTCTGGTCVAPTEANLCRDGLDNDNDTFIDCLDSDCPAGSLCSDLNACTMTDVCVADGGCEPGLPPTCDMPPNALCYDPTGGCAPDSGVCEYKLNAGATCNDGRQCTKGDTCDADGGCVGAPICDAPPSVCHAAIGVCDEADAGCTYAPRPPGGSCTDGNNCTRNDSCDGDGGCAGTLVPCAAPPECFDRSGCDEDGGCLYAPAPGQVCDGGASGAGTCSDAGTCVPTPTNVFPYTPSNFTEARLPATAGALVFGCGVTTLNTGAAGAATLTWGNMCVGNTAAPAFTEVTVGSQQAVLLFMESLVINGSNSLVVSGDCPLILAVRGAARSAAPSTSARRRRASERALARGAVRPPAATAGRGRGAEAAPRVAAAVARSESNGGAGAAGEGSAAAGTAGTAIAGTQTLTPLRGGCPGGNGGRSSAPDGVGGRGGGAVQLTVAGALQINATGRITAYGEGGQGGLNTGGTGASTRGGGGGGGSGGGILLEAATLTVNAQAAVTANGGAGGQGAGGSTGGDGPNGAADTAVPAPGGTSGTCGGFGGDGAAAATAAEGGFQASCMNGDSGGGGGGGAGRIYLRASTSCSINGTSIVSPAARGNGATNGCPAP